MSNNKGGSNRDGGHSHDHWNSSSDYSRKESNSSSNPSIGEVQNNGGCYLIS